MQIQKYKWLLDYREIVEQKIQPNPLWEENSSIINEALGELNNETKLKRFYVENPNNSVDLFRLPAFIIGISYSNYNTLMKNEDIENIEINHNGYNKKLIFLFGNAGVGKSTFLHYSFKIKVKEVEAKLLKRGLKVNENLSIFIDFKYSTTEISELELWVYQSIDVYYKESGLVPSRSEFDDLFKDDIDLYRNLSIDEEWIFSKKMDLIESFATNLIYRVKKISNYLQSNKQKKISIIFDNLDHHYNEDYIAKAIRVAQSLTLALGSTLIIALREVNHGVMVKNLFHDLTPHYLYYTNPDLDNTLKVRLSFAFNELNKIAYSNFEIDNPNHILQEEKVINLLKSASGKNVRVLLQIVRHMFKSGHLYSKAKNKVQFTYTRVLRALLFENFKVFRPADKRPEGLILNLFENEDPYNNGNILIRLRLLQILENQKTFIKLERVVSDMKFLGYSERSTLEVIDNFSNLPDKLLENHFYSNELGIRISNLRISELGKLHLKLVNEVEYLDAVRSATFFPNQLFEEINKSKLNVLENTFEQRKKEIELFIGFLINAEKDEFYKAKESADIFSTIKVQENVFKLKDYFLPKWIGQLKKISEFID